MGDGIKKNLKRTGLAVSTFGASEAKGGAKKVEQPFRKGATAAKRTAADQIAKQQQMESVRLAEAEGEVAKRKGSAFGKSAGRKSLIKSSAGGLATNLGGTA